MALTAVTRTDALMSLARDQLAASTLRSFREAGVPALLLKGAGFARWLYPEGTIRLSTDVDLLVDPARLRQAESVLRDHGWEPYLYPSVHARSWQKPGVHWTIDLHHSFHHVTVPHERCWELLSEDAEPVAVAGEVVSMPSKDAMATLLALHAVAQGSGARVQEELALALRTQDTDVWANAAKLADALGALDAFSVSLRGCREGAALADSLGLVGLVGLVGLAGRLDSGNNPGPGRSRSTMGGFIRLNDARKPAELLRLAVRELVPGPRQMRWRYPRLAGDEKLGGVGLGLAYVWRPLEIAFRAPRGWLDWRRLRKEQDRTDLADGVLDRSALVVEIIFGSLRTDLAMRRKGIEGALELVRGSAWPTQVDPVAARGAARISSSVRDFEVATGERLGALVERVSARLPGDSRCLLRSLVLVRILSARRIDSRLVLAVRRRPPSAHAWVEVHGQPVSTPAPSGFVRLAEL
ncbi:MAG: lasso peptide biosynthesis B2 protein [Acidimicrobiales bacterium]